MSEVNPVLGYADSYRRMARIAKAEGRHQMVDMFSVVTDLERNIAPLFTAAKSELAALREELAVQRESKEQWEKVAADWVNKANVFSNLMHEFCDRVDRGEVKSKATYAKFKAALSSTECSNILQQRLTAAEQRNAELVGLLTEIRAGYRPVLSNYMDAKILAAINPTESGASE